MEEKIRKLFPALEKYVYLNSAAVSPLPITTVEAVLSQLKDVSENGVLNYPKWIETKERARKLLAEMLSARPDQIAFTRNTSDGFSIVANGLDWSKDDNIVVFAGEFPSNFYPWRMIHERFGVELRISHNKNARVDIEEFISLIDKKTKIASISVVQFDTGFRANLEKISNVIKKTKALFAVDIIQGFGAIELNLTEISIDIASGASHKWLCAPEGCGILYLSDRARQMIKPSLVGWISVEEPWDFNDRSQSWKQNTLVLESGTGCTSLFYGLEQSLKIIKEIGVKRIEKYLENLTDFLCEKAKEKGYKVYSSRRKGEKSQIVAICPKNGSSAQEITKSLEKKNIIISARNNLLRISPHFFNNEDDIEILVDHLP
ncbi:MAG: aminotransferase class V-fold PLP-dependent enzyme [Acidobacteriota bacterium]|nr:aminotransferase class V-fold PLP-dependent enzyme [Pyrinomonadaceae bacterium]MDW8304296.1 aminotransferase class V-fold PLP-dependent enzyme [Acidobacteriota bacterium]